LLRNDPEECSSLLGFYLISLEKAREWHKDKHKLFALQRLINLLEPELFILILAHPVYKMWIMQEPNKLELWNKMHFEEKKLRIYTIFKICSTCICWINI